IEEFRMSKWPLAIAAGLGLMVLGTSSLRLQAQLQNPAPQPRAVIDKYCVTCHNAKAKIAGLALDTLDIAHVAEHAAEWEKVARKLRTAEMPPPGLPRPDADTYHSVVRQLEAALDSAAAANPNPGRVPVHRLNRSEYTATIRDLLGLEIDGRTLLAA